MNQFFKIDIILFESSSFGKKTEKKYANLDLNNSKHFQFLAQ